MDVSIIIPTFNEEKNISSTLKSVINQDYDGKYEIIIIDGNSTDNTIKIISKFIENNKNIKLILENGKPNIARARNIGVNNAKGKIIAFIDAGRIAPKDWIKKIINCFKNEDIVGVGGSFELAKNNLNLLEKFIALDKIYRTNIQSKYTDVVCTGNAAFKKQSIKEIGGFNEFFAKRGENTDLCYRLKGKILFQPNINVFYKDFYNAKKFIKEHILNSFYYLLVCLKHKNKTLKDDYRKSSFIIQPFFIALLLLSIPFNTYLPIFFFLLFLIVNINFLRFVSKYSKKMILPSIILQFTRTVLWIVGVIFGLIYLLKIRLMK